ncbi:MAG TPA: GyrI-like domain-containing protein [Thermoplasmata archaeon]|nr:GyrI-like domain-containing protein [Thermoplasmata archaeon]
MTVDFSWKNAPSYRVAAIVRVGPWKEDNLRPEFGELSRWAARQGLRTGRWIFFERNHHRWEACLEVKGRGREEGRIRLKTLPPARAASILFDPEQVSSRIVYHGLIDWTRQRKRDGTIKAVTQIREIYPGDPWKDPKAWSRCEVQFLVRR